ncbi:hypothetical protein FRC03_007041 [Tulasnella sp. 419]|nr:hypothetical protein FRC03_007041 [Tulasnella sp. 419]
MPPGNRNSQNPVPFTASSSTLISHPKAARQHLLRSAHSYPRHSLPVPSHPKRPLIPVLTGHSPFKVVYILFLNALLLKECWFTFKSLTTTLLSFSHHGYAQHMHRFGDEGQGHI